LLKLGSLNFHGTILQVCNDLAAQITQTSNRIRGLLTQMSYAGNWGAPRRRVSPVEEDSTQGVVD
jgi:hypothetical protein